MKKVNGILIVIAILSLGLLFFIAYATGLIELPQKQSEPDDLQQQVKDDYARDFTKNKEITVKVSENLFLYRDIQQVYSYEFQKEVRDNIERMIEVGDYTEDNPLLILNPFCTNSQSLYTYFETSYPCAVSYSIHTSALTSAVPDFGGHVKAVEVGNSYVHEFAITGLVPNEKNIISLYMVDEKGEKRQRTFYYDFGNVYSHRETALNVAAGTKTVTDEETGEEKTVNASDITLEEGLYAVFSQRNDFAPYVKIYDNDGYLRSEIPLEEVFAKKLLVKDGEIYLFVSANKLVRINSLGEVTHIYRINDYTLTGDWCMDEKGNILATATRNDRMRTSMRDCIVIIDFTDEDIYMLIDFAKLMTDVHLLECVAKSEPDWIGITGVSYVGENMIVVSSEKLNSMIKIRRIYNDPRPVYFAGDPGKLKGTAYEDLYLNNEGNFAFSSTTDTVGYIEYDKIRTTRQYIWTMDRNIKYKYGKKEEPFGYYVRYLTDEQEKTVRLYESVKLPKVTEDFSLYKFNDNWLYVGGDESVFYEYDQWFDLIATFTFTPEKVRKTVEQMDYEEDNPPPDDSVKYIGICKFDPFDYLFAEEEIVYKNSAYEEQMNAAE